MNKNVGIVAVVTAVIFAGAGFWGGTMYAQSSATAQGGQRGNFAGRTGGGARFANGGNAFGTIIAKDATSITVQLTGGPNASSTNNGATGSKIVLYSDATQVGKFVTGSANDLAVGSNVVVMGTANSDGSITAQSIQIRPAGMPGFGGGFRGNGTGGSQPQGQ